MQITLYGHVTSGFAVAVRSITCQHSSRGCFLLVPIINMEGDKYGVLVYHWSFPPVKRLLNISVRQYGVQNTLVPILVASMGIELPMTQEVVRTQ